MNVLVMYTELMGYTANTLKQLSLIYGAKVTVVCQDCNKKTPFFPTDHLGVRYMGVSRFNRNSLKELLHETAPDLVFVSGWQNKDYLAVALEAKGMGIPVVSGMDNQWHGTFRQRLACILSFFFIHRYFDYIQVSGRLQYEYAARLGFSRTNILMNLYSADTQLFAEKYYSDKELKQRSYPHRFLFVGRLHQNKGIDVLLSAWKAVCEQGKHDWQLVVIGDGPLSETFEAQAQVVYKPFMQPVDLVEEIITAGVFVLPSRKEPWGVVVHEFAAAGLPLILSDVCGAATEFLISGYNGYSFQNESVVSLSKSLRCIINMKDEDLQRMGSRSHEMSKRITPEMSVASMMIPVLERS